MEKFIDLQKSASLLLGLFPFILMLVFWEVRTSISDYSNASNQNLFAMIIAIVASFYSLDAYWTNRKYNYLLSVGLLFIGLFNHSINPILHYFGALIYFGGLTFFAIKYSSNKQRWFISVLFGFGLFFLIFTRLFYLPGFLWSEIYMVLLASFLSHGELTGKIV